MCERFRGHFAIVDLVPDVRDLHVPVDGRWSHGCGDGQTGQFGGRTRRMRDPDGLVEESGDVQHLG